MKKRLLFAFTVFLYFTGNMAFSQNDCCDYTKTSNQPGVSGETFGVSLGDIDGDGDLDAVVVDAYDDMEVYLNDGTGSFTYDESYGSSEAWFGVYLVDVDMDEDLDIIVAAFYSGNGAQLWLNNGSGSFTFHQGGIASSIATEELGIGDLNGDGLPDIFLPASSGSSSQVWLNDGNNFYNSNQSLTGSGCTEAALADFDGDGDLDAFVSRTNSYPNLLWLNDGLGNFVDSGQQFGTARSTGVDAADLDGDGDTDVVVANWQTNSQVWLNDGEAVFTAGFEIENNNYAKAIKTSDIDYDCDYDVIIGSYGSNGLQVWTNDGTGSFSLCYENPVGVYAHDLDVADLNNDLMPDIWVGNFSSSNGDHIYLKASPEIIYDTINLCQYDSIFIACDWRSGSGDFIEFVDCDTLNKVHIAELNIDTTVIQSSDTLFAVADYEGYHWLNCKTMDTIEGAVNYYFVAPETGSFAVEITEQLCVDTSGCHSIELPTADFEGEPFYGDAPLTVNFTDLSYGDITSWEWDFGDGNTSTEQNPDNEYLQGGFYTVKLKVVGSGSSDSITKLDYINVNFVEPTADFVGTPTSGEAPLEVTFTDLSADSVNTWNWDFGDGGTSNFQNPVYVYNDAGTYNVSLTVEGPGGSNEMTKTDYIQVLFAAPIADFEGNPTFGEAPLMVNFTDLSTGEIDSWAWSFGDGGSATDQHPSHEYIEPGNFTVSLTVVGPGGDSTKTKIDYILIPVTIGENPAETILVYPNPTSDVVHVVFPDAGERQLSLSNEAGIVLLRKTVNNKNELLQLQHLPKGVYSLVISYNETISTVKIVLQ